jgi:hypothetical protein
VAASLATVPTHQRGTSVSSSTSGVSSQGVAHGHDAFTTPAAAGLLARKPQLSFDPSGMPRSRPPGSVMTSNTTRTRSIGTMLAGASDAVLPLARKTASAGVAVSPTKSSGRTFDSVLASFPKSLQFAIREMILDIMELEMRREMIEERQEVVRAAGVSSLWSCASLGCLTARLRYHASLLVVCVPGGGRTAARGACGHRQGDF